MNIFKAIWCIFKPQPPSFGIKGTLEARVKRAGSPVKELLFVVPNIIVNIGLARVAGFLGDGGLYYTKGAVGEGSGGEATADEALDDQVDIQAAEISLLQTSVPNDTCQWVTTHVAPGGGWNIVEYGLKLSNGTGLFNRVTFGAVELNEDDELEFTYKCQVKRAT